MTFNNEINYLEIGCYAGASSCLMIQRPNTNVFAIDIGYPVNKQSVLMNINKLNKNHNYFEYIQGYSNDNIVLNRVKEIKNGIDILFIDGDHSYDGVLSDFNLYSGFVNNGGYIIFDDYNDHYHSPEVKPSVDDIIKSLNGYEIIGCLDNIYGARPSELKEGNCFIIRKWKNWEL
jgi:cephalosporin hydroxylase